jgi:hypothetical protein
MEFEIRNCIVSSTYKPESSLSNVPLSHLKSANESERKLLQRARVLYSQQEYPDCAEVLKSLCKSFPHSKLGNAELSKVISRLLEQRRGIYNWKLLYSEVRKLCPPCLDHATYTGSVEVRESKGKNRGYFTTASVKAGDLLLCEKAFSYHYAEYSIGRSGGLMATTIEKLSNHPNLIATFSHLYHGSYTPTLETANKPIVDP